MAGQADVAANSLEDISNANLIAFALSRPKNLYTIVGKKGFTKVEDIRSGKLGAADPGSIANTIAEKIFEKHGIAKTEALFLADRVIMMNVAKVVKSVPIDLPRPRWNQDTRTDPHYIDLRNGLLGTPDAQVVGAAGGIL